MGAPTYNTKTSTRTKGSTATGKTGTAAPKPLKQLSRKQERAIEEGSNRRGSMLDQLMSMFGAYDALTQNINSRFDPTIPALTNSMLQQYANMMSGGPANVNAMLGGDYSHSAPSVPVTLGAGNGSPFDMAFQKPGMDEGVYQMFQNLIQPTYNDQLNNLTGTLFQMGSQNYYDPTSKVQRPSPGLTAPNWEALGGQAKPITSLPVQTPPAQVAPAQSPVQPPPAQKPTDTVPQYALGTPYVPQTGAAILHQGEAVVPAQQNIFAQVPQAQDWGKVSRSPLGQQNPRAQQAAAPAPAPQPAPAPAPAPMPQPPAVTQDIGQAPAQAPVANTTMPAPAPAQTYDGAVNPVQQAINQLSQMLSTGGPMNADYLNRQNQQMADASHMAYQQQLANMQSQMGARGLGGSGLQYGMQNDLFNGLQSGLIQGQNQNALAAATGNWNALQGGAGNLANTALNAGQFGLQQQQAQLGNQMSMFEMLLNALKNTTTAPAAA